jgi:tetratricopeptide (TPR) repeat protein
MRNGERERAFGRYLLIHERFGEEADNILPATRELAGLYWEAGDMDASLDLLAGAEERCEVDEHRVQLREEIGRRLQQRGDWEGATAALQRIHDEFPDNPVFRARAQLAEAGIADKRGFFNAAVDLYRTVAAAHVDAGMTAAAYFGQATLLRRRGDPEGAMPLMDAALAALPKQHTMRGSIAVERSELLVEMGAGTPAEMQAMLSEARDAGLEDEQPGAYTHLLLYLAQALAAADRHYDALQTFQRVADSVAAADDPSLKHAAIEGQVASLVALDRKDQADELLNNTPLSALTTGEAGETCLAQISLARGRLESGEAVSAAELFTEVFGTCRSPRFLVSELPAAADLLVESGRVEDAIAILRAVRDGDVPGVGKQAAELELGRLGNEEDLVAAASGPDRSLAALAKVERAHAYGKDGRIEAAMPLWTEVANDLTLDPSERLQATLGLAQAARNRGDLDDAETMYRRVLDESPDAWLREEGRRGLQALGAGESESGDRVGVP